MKRYLHRYLRPIGFTLCLILCICFAAPLSFAQASTQLRFPASGKLKIMLLADTQNMQNISQNFFDGVNAVLDAEKPDLVIFLGDQVEGQHPLIHTGDNEENVKSVIEQTLAPIVSRKIPFAVVFGNHDGVDSGVSKETQMAYYRTFPGCLAIDEGDTLPGCGTYNLLYYTADGTKPAVNLYLIDSLEYDPKGGYGCVTKEQITWCSTVGKTLTTANGGKTVPSLAFQHIVVPEVYNLFTPVQEDGAPDAFEGRGYGKGRFYSVLLSSKYIEGAVNEAPCPPSYSNGQFDAWVNAGDVKAAFFGHDHLNAFSGNLDGVDLVMAPGSTFTSYNTEEARGVRIVELDEKTIADGTYTSRVLYFKDFYKRGPIAAIQRFFGMSRFWDYTLLFTIILFVLGNLIFWPAFILLRKRKKAKAAAAAASGEVPAHGKELPAHITSGASTDEDEA